MSTLGEIQQAILDLPKPDFETLSRWFSELEWDRWDAEIEEDCHDGRLDLLSSKPLETELTVHCGCGIFGQQ